jgi:hypothetical protein
MKRAIIASMCITLAACTSEDDRERACYDKLKSDFEGYAETSVKSAEGKSSDKRIAAGKLAIAARESALAITLIWSDDDRSACDYVSAGPYLQRK